MPNTSPDQLNELELKIKALAHDLGFQQVGISGIDLKQHEQFLQNWLIEGMHGEMDYMARHGSKRSHPEELVPGTIRVISVRMDYLPPEASLPQEILKDKNKTFRGTHPDLAIIFPEFEGHEKKEIMNLRRNKEYFKLRQRKGHISIETVRKLQDYTYVTPMENKWKIVIIAHSDRITKEGFNAFLKILEEPPPNVIFILITPEKHFLPKTIISRSQTVRFSPLSAVLQKEILKNETISRFGRGIEETQFLNSQKELEERIEKMFFSLSGKSRLKN